jgi:hypothetical protein
MVFDWQGFQSYLTLIGSVLGIISALILFVRYLREKPILKLSIGNGIHSQGTIYRNGSINFSLSVDNHGERGTTIKDIILMKTSPVDYSSYYIEHSGFSEVRHLAPHNSLVLNVSFDLENHIIAEENITFDALLLHTHGQEKFSGKSGKREGIYLAKSKE